MTVGLFGAGTAFAAQETVPIDSLQPAVELQKPQLTGVGGKLILSDSPETFTEPGAFYRDRVEGEFRVFWHHQNASETTYDIGVAVTNTSNDTVKLFTKGNGLGTSIWVDVAGQIALADFISTEQTTNRVATLAPGESYFYTAPTETQITNSGIVQFDARTQQGNAPAEVTVTTLSYVDQPVHPEETAVLPEGDLTRGTFPHFDRLGTIQYDTAMGNARLSVDSAAYGPWGGNDMPGEYEDGWDAVDGKTVINNGNYGVTYHFNVDITNSYHKPLTGSLYLNPSGGFGHYVVKWNQQLYQSDWFTWENAWHITDFNINPNEKTYRAEMSLTGGAAGPQVIYFTNGPKNAGE